MDFLGIIRVTNLREKKIDANKIPSKIFNNYKKVVLEHTKTRVRPTQRIEIQLLPNAFLLDSDYAIGDLDNGLIYIGTQMCFNHENPKHQECPIKSLCEGYLKNQSLIKDYRT